MYEVVAPLPPCVLTHSAILVNHRPTILYKQTGDAEGCLSNLNTVGAYL